MMRRHRWLLVTFTALSGQTPGVLAQDPTVGAIVHRVISFQLVGGGRRDTVTWQAADSSTLSILRSPHLPLNPSIVGPLTRVLECPGSTDLEGAALAQPVGYKVKVSVHTRSTLETVIDVTVSCRFSYRGRPKLFLESGKWLLRRGSKGWILDRELEHSIT